MNKTRLFLVIAFVLGAGAVAVTYPLWSPYFIDDVVDDPFPMLTEDERDQIEALPQEQQDALVQMMDEAAEMARSAIEDPVEVSADQQTMPEGMPDEPIILRQGNFIDIDVIHGAEGVATVYELEDGSRVLRFEEFRSTNGPDLHVILSTHPDPRSRSQVGDDYIDLGELRGNVGNQNYTISADVDLSEYNSVVIYCLPFHVVFSTATLN